MLSVVAARRILASAALGLGFLHLAVAGPQLGAITPQVLWFLGSGLAIIVAGLSGFASPTPVVVVKHLSMAAFFVLAWTVIGSPQTVIGAALFLGLAALSLTGLRAGADPSKRE